MTDNGTCSQLFDFRDTCRAFGHKHARTSPHTPKFNGKAERSFKAPAENRPTPKPTRPRRRRAQELPVWLHRYNWHRPHGGYNLKHQSADAVCPRDNLLRLRRVELSAQCFSLK